MPLDVQELIAQIGAVTQLLLEARISHGEITVACGRIINKYPYDVREEKVAQAIGILETFNCEGMPLAVLAAAIIKGL